jgi:hypothetical protein
VKCEDLDEVQSGIDMASESVQRESLSTDGFRIADYENPNTAGGDWTTVYAGTMMEVTQSIHGEYTIPPCQIVIQCQQNGDDHLGSQSQVRSTGIVEF